MATDADIILGLDDDQFQKGLDLSFDSFGAFAESLNVQGGNFLQEHIGSLLSFETASTALEKTTGPLFDGLENVSNAFLDVGAEVGVAAIEVGGFGQVVGTVISGVSTFIGVSVALAAALATVVAVVAVAVTGLAVLAAHFDALQDRIDLVNEDGLAKFRDELAETTKVTVGGLADASSQLRIFGDLSENQFKRALEASVGLSTFLEGGLSESSKLVAESLQNPVKSIYRLEQAGVVFSQTQEKLIKGFVDIGDVSSAQEVVLGELTKRFSGASDGADSFFTKAYEGWGELTVASRDALANFGEFTGISRVLSALWDMVVLGGSIVGTFLVEPLKAVQLGFGLVELAGLKALSVLEYIPGVSFDGLTEKINEVAASSTILATELYNAREELIGLTSPDASNQTASDNKQSDEEALSRIERRKAAIKEEERSMKSLKDLIAETNQLRFEAAGHKGNLADSEAVAAQRAIVSLLKEEAADRELIRDLKQEGLQIQHEQAGGIGLFDDTEQITGEREKLEIIKEQAKEQEKIADVQRQIAQFNYELSGGAGAFDDSPAVRAQEEILQNLKEQEKLRKEQIKDDEKRVDEIFKIVDLEKDLSKLRNQGPNEGTTGTLDGFISRIDKARSENNDPNSKTNEKISDTAAKILKIMEDNEITQAEVNAVAVLGN